MHLTIKQTIALDKLEDSITNEVLFGGGAGGGKSAFGCYWLLKMCHKYPGTRWVMGRAVLKTLKETTLNSFYQIASMQRLKAGVHYIFNAQTNVIKFPNGSEILCKDLYNYPSDPNFDELGSLEITGGFIDECNQVVEKAWNILKSRIRYKLDEYGIIPKILGTCNPSKNWVYTRFYQPSVNGSLPENFCFIQSLLTDNPHISKHYRENLLSMNDIAAKERLLYGNWQYDDDPTALMPFDKIQNIFSNEWVTDEAGEKYITADIARYGRDMTVIGLWSGHALIEIKTMKQNSVPEAAATIRNIAQRNKIPLSDVIVDDDGVGGGVVDILGCNGFVNNSSPLENPETREPENYANLKSQCYFYLAQKVNSNGLYIKTEDPAIKQSIIQELEQVKQKDMDKDGKRAVIPKDKVKELIGRSPDLSDMLMMRMWFDLKPKFEWSF